MTHTVPIRGAEVNEPMYDVDAPTTIANVTDLRRDTTALFDRLEKGRSVIIQRNTEPVAVLVGPEQWEELQEARRRLSELEQVLTAMSRERELDEDDATLLTEEELMGRLHVAEGRSRTPGDDE